MWSGRGRGFCRGFKGSKSVAFPDGVKEVTILRDGARRIIVPLESVWDDFFDLPGIDIGERSQPPLQDREAL